MQHRLKAFTSWNGLPSQQNHLSSSVTGRSLVTLGLGALSGRPRGIRLGPSLLEPLTGAKMQDPPGKAWRGVKNWAIHHSLRPLIEACEAILTRTSGLHAMSLQNGKLNLQKT